MGPQDNSRARNAIQSGLLEEISVRTTIYPEFAVTDWSGEVPVVQAVTLTWDEFVHLAGPWLTA